MKAKLAMTDEDHRSIGSTLSPALKANPGKTLAETMNDLELHSFLRAEFDGVNEVFAGVKAGTLPLRALETVRDSFFLPNIQYLKEIGRLPAEFADIDFAKEFTYESPTDPSR